MHCGAESLLTVRSLLTSQWLIFERDSQNSASLALNEAEVFSAKCLVFGVSGFLKTIFKVWGLGQLYLGFVVSSLFFIKYISSASKIIMQVFERNPESSASCLPKLCKVFPLGTIEGKIWVTHLQYSCPALWLRSGNMTFMKTRYSEGKCANYQSQPSLSKAHLVLCTSRQCLGHKMCILREGGRIGQHKLTKSVQKLCCPRALTCLPWPTAECWSERSSGFLNAVDLVLQ